MRKGVYDGKIAEIGVCNTEGILEGVGGRNGGREGGIGDSLTSRIVGGTSMFTVGVCTSARTGTSMEEDCWMLAISLLLFISSSSLCRSSS